jgi:hypothetical protein
VEPFVSILLAAGLIGGIVGGVAISTRRRRRALEALARARGWSFAADDPGLGFPEVQIRKKGRCYDFLVEMNDRPRFAVFTWSWSAGNHQVVQTVMAHRLERDNAPHFLMRPEGVVDRIVDWMGSRDIDFVENEAFSRKYRLEGDDEPAIRTLFRPEVLQRFARGETWYVEGWGAWVFFYRQGRRVAPDAIARQMDETRRLAGLFEGR